MSPVPLDHLASERRQLGSATALAAACRFDDWAAKGDVHLLDQEPRTPV